MTSVMTSQPRAIPRPLDVRPMTSATSPPPPLQPSYSTAPVVGNNSSRSSSVSSHDSWIQELSLGLQQICGSPPMVSRQHSITAAEETGHPSPMTPPPHAMTWPTSAGPFSPAALSASKTSSQPSDSGAQRALGYRLEPRNRRSTPSPPVVGLGSVVNGIQHFGGTTVGQSRIGDGGVFRRTVSLMGQHVICNGGPMRHASGGSQQLCQTGGRSRPIIVRHVETHELLAKQLSGICSSGGSNLDRTHSALTSPIKTETTNVRMNADTVDELPTHKVLQELNSAVDRSGDDSNSRKAAAAAFLRPDGGCIRLKVNVAPYRSEDLIVSIRKSTGASSNMDSRVVARTVFQIEAISGDSVRLLHTADTAFQPDASKRLLGQMTANGWLYIRERVTSTGNGDCSPLTVDFGSAAAEPAFVPVLFCNEDRLEITLVVHVPDQYRFEDVTVKTIDDRVVISGDSRSQMLTSLLSTSDADVSGRSQTTSQAALLSPAMPSSSLSSRFRIVVPLPEGTDNRSVCASLTPRNQVIVKARLGSLSRRYTF